MNTFRHLYLIGISILLFAFQLSAEDGVFSGYVILDNDTKEKGLVIPGGAFDNQEGITFRSGNDEIYYSTESIKGYGFEEKVVNKNGLATEKWRHFERKTLDFAPVPDGSETVFVEVKALGKLDLFSIYIELKADVDDKVRQLYLAVDESGKTIKINKISFMKRARIIFRDYPGLQSNLGKPRFRYQDMARMVNDYNFQKENGHDIDRYVASPEEYAEKEMP